MANWISYTEPWIYFGASILSLSYVWREWTHARAERLRREADDIKFYDALK